VMEWKSRRFSIPISEKKAKVSCPFLASFTDWDFLWFCKLNQQLCYGSTGHFGGH